MIAIFCSDIDAGGGVETVSKRLDTEFNKNGIKSRIYSIRSSTTYTNSFSFSFNSKKLDKNIINLISNKFREDSIDSVIFQLNDPVVCVLANVRLIKSLSENGIRCFVVLHNSPKSFITRYKSFNDNLLVFLLKFLKTKLILAPKAKLFIKKINMFSTLVALCEGGKREFQKYYKRNSVVVPNCFNVSCCSEKDLELKTNTILMISRIEYSAKNFKLLLDSWNSVKDKKGWNLKILGSGDKKFLENYIKSFSIQNISLHESVPNEEVIALMRTSKILALSSYYEGFPTVVIEAASQGNAIVTTKYDGFSDEIVKNGLNGFVVGLNSEEMSSRFQEIINNENLLNDMQKKSLSIVQAYKNENDVIYIWKEHLQN